VPEKKTIERATRDKREGKAPTTQAGEFVREEIHHVRRGQAWCSLDQAGDRDRSVQGAPSGCGSSIPLEHCDDYFFQSGSKKLPWAQVGY